MGEAARGYAAAVPFDTTVLHYDVWDADGFVAFLLAAIARWALPLSLRYTSATVHEIIVVLEKTDAQAATVAALPAVVYARAFNRLRTASTNGPSSA